jgi:hypothetical protein
MQSWQGINPWQVTDYGKLATALHKTSSRPGEFAKFSYIQASAEPIF